MLTPERRKLVVWLLWLNLMPFVAGALIIAYGLGYYRVDATTDPTMLYQLVGIGLGTGIIAALLYAVFVLFAGLMALLSYGGALAAQKMDQIVKKEKIASGTD